VPGVKPLPGPRLSFAITPAYGALMEPRILMCWG
jgi:hypothetical protein